MSNEFTLAIPIALLPECGITGIYDSVNLADAYSIRLPSDAVADPELLARFMYAQQAPWIRGLTKVRDVLVSGIGLKTAKHLEVLAMGANASRLGIFKIYSKSENEIVLGEDDKHLDFRLSVFCPRESGQERHRQVVISTVVHCHNRLGRAYIFLIAPFHRVVVKSILGRAVRVGWPREKCV